MKKKLPSKRSQKRQDKLWLIRIFCLTLALSIALSLASEVVTQRVPVFVALAVLVVFILLNFCADIVGTAIASVEAKPFYAMSSKRIYGAETSLWLVKHADRVANICCDVIGDVTGIVSGGMGAAIAFSLALRFWGREMIWVSVLVSALIAAATVCSKAAAKNYALQNDKAIIFFVGRALQVFFRKTRAGKGK